MLPISLTAFSDKNRTRKRMAKHLITTHSQRPSLVSASSRRLIPPVPSSGMLIPANLS
jgi:hypothetical protein